MTEGFTLLQTFQPQTVRNIFSPHTRMFSLPSAKLQKRKALLALKVPLDRSRLRFDHWFPVSGHTRGFRVEGEPKMWAICMMISTKHVYRRSVVGLWHTTHSPPEGNTSLTMVSQKGPTCIRYENPRERRSQRPH